MVVPYISDHNSSHIYVTCVLKMTRHSHTLLLCQCDWVRLIIKRCVPLLGNSWSQSSLPFFSPPVPRGRFINLNMGRREVSYVDRKGGQRRLQKERWSHCGNGKKRLTTQLAQQGQNILTETCRGNHKQKKRKYTLILYNMATLAIVPAIGIAQPLPFGYTEEWRQEREVGGRDLPQFPWKCVKGCPLSNKKKNREYHLLPRNNENWFSFLRSYLSSCSLEGKFGSLDMGPPLSY